MVDFAATVWINGQLIGKNEGPEIPFEFDITDALDYENENWIVVRVLNPTNEPIDGIILAQTPHRNKHRPVSNRL